MATLLQRESLVVCLLSVVLCLLITDVQGDLTTTPQNVLVLKGQNATLNCSSDSLSAQGRNPITWNYDGSVISYEPCTSSHPGFITSSPNSTTDCNVEALWSSPDGISGAYRCIERPFEPSAVAMVVVLEPVCEVAQVSLKGQNATLVCRMTYNWQAPGRQFALPPVLNVSLSWTNAPGTSVSTVADPATSSGIIETNRTLEDVTEQTISSYNCEIDFSFTAGPGRYMYAVNSLSSTCTTNPTKVWNCPSVVTVTPSSGTFKPGDKLTCASDGFPELTYTWTDDEGKTLSTGADITLTTEGRYNLTCTATGNFATTCSASQTVSLTVDDGPASTAEKRSRLSSSVMVLTVIVSTLMVIAESPRSCWMNPSILN